jgi:hypothetical protein
VTASISFAIINQPRMPPFRLLCMSSYSFSLDPKPEHNIPYVAACDAIYLQKDMGYAYLVSGTEAYAVWKR